MDVSEFSVLVVVGNNLSIFFRKMKQMAKIIKQMAKMTKQMELPR